MTWMTNKYRYTSYRYLCIVPVRWSLFEVLHSQPYAVPTCCSDPGSSHRCSAPQSRSSPQRWKRWLWKGFVWWVSNGGCCSAKMTDECHMQKTVCLKKKKAAFYLNQGERNHIKHIWYELTFALLPRNVYLSVRYTTIKHECNKIITTKI